MYASSSACVGCWCVPSPALITAPSIQPARGQRVRGAGGVVPDDDRVGAHRLQRQRGVLEGLALGHAGALGGEVDDVRGQPLGGGLERDARAGGVLEEQVDHRAAAQRRQLLDLAALRGGHQPGGVEDPDGVGAASRSAVGQQVLHRAPPLDQDLVAPVGAPRAARGRARSWRWAGSCRRSRRGWAARGGRGRRARPAGPRGAGRGR